MTIAHMVPGPIEEVDENTVNVALSYVYKTCGASAIFVGTPAKK